MRRMLYVMRVLVLICLLVFSGFAPLLKAQDAVFTAGQKSHLLMTLQLSDELMEPIALYPDALLA